MRARGLLMTPPLLVGDEGGESWPEEGNGGLLLRRESR